MSSKRVGPLAQAWYKWKALRLPWRKRFLVGFDLQGNTYWEFRLTQRGPDSSAERWRRIVKYPRSAHFSSVKVSPQWHQWLRHTRDEPPTLGEQQGDVVRQAKLKYLAARADARWDAKLKVMDIPVEEKALPEADSTDAELKNNREDAEKNKQKGVGKDAEEENPWAKAKAQGPSEKWQPEAWTPSAKK